MSAAEDTENKSESDTMKTIRRFTKPKFRQHPILSQMNSGDSHVRDSDTDSDMPGLQEQALEDESSDNNSEKDYYRLPALVLRDRNRSESSSDDDSDIGNNN